MQIVIKPVKYGLSHITRGFLLYRLDGSSYSLVSWNVYRTVKKAYTAGIELSAHVCYCPDLDKLI